MPSDLQKKLVGFALIGLGALAGLVLASGVLGLCVRAFRWAAWGEV